MTIPMELQHAGAAFEAFLRDAQELSGLATRNPTYTMVQGVFQVFRRRLSLKDAIRFATVLPPLLRAIFIDDWDVEEPQRPFGSRAEMTREAQALRRDHNFAPDSCIRDVAEALRRHVDAARLDRVLATLPEGAADFWRV